MSELQGTAEDALGELRNEDGVIERVDAASLRIARRLASKYLIVSTAVFLAAGLLGLIIRDSQSDVGRIDPNTWYALMTAHGLGEFLGWAGFAVMGFAWLVLAEVGFPIRRLGKFFAEATFVLMVLGVVGVLVSTLILHFAGSWVFLYPLPFHGAKQWGEWTTAIFSLSVLSVGLSIVTWCLGILDTVIGPALHAKSSSIFNRLGVSMGFGFLWPKKFATNPRRVPYPVIPLAVIGLDMIIATLPLAVLLIEMVVQSFTPSVSVDPLLAKNVLWWFGHPVVYLLLFPAVAIYYVLIPKYARRPLVAGNVIAVAWGVAVVANVLVWAHHIYLDFPSGTTQAALNVAMQPMTFALVLPSALSLYSLSFTIYRSNFKWTGASLALFLGMVSWLLAGLSGIVNATVAFDEVVHNTLWVVGHFHQMALLNIGLAVIGATYHWLPELCGKQLYSDRLAKQHVWGTFLFGTANTGLWLAQGLQGAPRRFAVLPSAYDTLARWGVIVSLLLGATQLLFVFNIVQTLRGRVAKKRTRSWTSYDAEAVYMVLVLAFVGGAFALGFFVGRDAHSGSGSGKGSGTTPVAGSTSTGSTSTTPTSTSPTSPLAAGKQVFLTAGCTACHTLNSAGSTGTVGPNLDQLKPEKKIVTLFVTNGAGAMPSFKGKLTPAQIDQVATFVSQTAGK